MLDDEDYQPVDKRFGLHEDVLIRLHAFYEMLLPFCTTETQGSYSRHTRIWKSEKITSEKMLKDLEDLKA